MTGAIAFHYHWRMTGSKVRRVRQAMGLTQQQFADRLGVHKVTVAKWETDAQGMRGPAARLIALLGATALGRSGKQKRTRAKLRDGRTLHGARKPKD